MAEKKRIYVGELDADINREEIRELFSSFGNILRVSRRHPSHQPMCYAFIDFENASDAEKAINGMNGKRIKGFRLRVRYAESQESCDSSSEEVDEDDEECGYSYGFHSD